MPVCFDFQIEFRISFIHLQVIFDTRTYSVDKCTFLIDMEKPKKNENGNESPASARIT
jgi:hypothetical protein